MNKEKEKELADSLVAAISSADEAIRKKKPKSDNGWFETTQEGLLFKQVCSHLEGDALVDMVNMYEPSGTSNVWKLSEKKEHAPVQCAEHSNKKHYILIC